jgi:uncharacterized protein (DUF1501 family)
MCTRRDFLRSSSLVALAPTVPAFLARTACAAKPERDGRILVVIQLDGGNDGINTVVPFKDEGYAKHRKQLRLPKEQLVKVDGTVGLHPAMRDAGKLLEAGHFTIVQGVGYPNPSRSHFESMAVWQTARRDPRDHSDYGWLGRSLDEDTGHDGKSTGVPAMVYVGGGQMPPALRGRRSITSALTRPEDFLLAPEARQKRTAAARAEAEDLVGFVSRMAVDAQATAERMKEVLDARDNGPPYPGTALAEQLKLIARLIKAGAGTRVFYTRQPGYDTHASQGGAHFGLLSALSTALKAFLDDLAAAKLAERVVVLCFSEFGRTVRENDSAGTDHGTAGPVFLAGPLLKGGLVGTTPSLLDLDPKHGDLKVSLDFRRVYAAVLEDWLALPSGQALGGKFERLALFRKG